MKRGTAFSLWVAVFSLAFPITAEAQAKTPKNPPAAPSAGTAAMQSDAARMLSAQAGVVKPIDVKKILPGQKFEVVLSGKVQLKNGSDLPRGTVLVGTASSGDAQKGGAAKLTLRFTEAQLKGGKTIPIKATMVGIFPANSPERDRRDIWNSSSLRIYQSGILLELELRSNIEDSNSGVFQSTKGML